MFSFPPTHPHSLSSSNFNYNLLLSPYSTQQILTSPQNFVLPTLWLAKASCVALVGVIGLPPVTILVAGLGSGGGASAKLMLFIVLLLLRALESVLSGES